MIVLYIFNEILKNGKKIKKNSQKACIFSLNMVSYSKRGMTYDDAGGYQSQGLKAFGG